MFEVQMLHPGLVPATGIKVYSPWFPRQADSLRVTLDVVQIAGAIIKVEVFTKNSEDIGDGVNSNAALFINGAAVGRTTTEWLSGGVTSIKEMVRYRFTVTGVAITDWVLFRMLAPVWFNMVTA